MKNPDMLRFYLPTGVTHEVGWAGPWPPPETMTVSVGRETGVIKVFRREETDVGLLTALDECATIDVYDFKLANASRLPDDFVDAHVFRGAEYRIAT